MTNIATSPGLPALDARTIQRMIARARDIWGDQMYEYFRSQGWAEPQARWLVTCGIPWQLPKPPKEPT